ncbi:hypothetical protein V6N13_132553 [Hibiscus sabdariffa]
MLCYDIGNSFEQSGFDGVHRNKVFDFSVIFRVSEEKQLIVAYAYFWRAVPLGTGSTIPSSELFGLP